MSCDVTIYKNDSVDLNVTVVDSNGDPVDISGADLQFEIRNNLITDTIIQVFTPSDIEITDGPSGEVTIHLSKDDTELLDPHTEYFYELRGTVDGKATTILSSSLEVLPRLAPII